MLRLFRFLPITFGIRSSYILDVNHRVLTWMLTSSSNLVYCEKKKRYGRLTNVRHLRHSCWEWSIRKCWSIVIDILDLDDELWLCLQRVVCLPVNGSCVEHILRFPFSVQALGCMNVARCFVNYEDRTRPLARQDVPHWTVALVRVGVELEM